MPTVDALIRQLKTGTPYERTLAAHALGDHHDPRAIDALIQTLEDQSEGCGVRMTAADALGRIGNPKAIEPLIRTMEEICERHLHHAVAEALGAFHDPRVTNTLIKALGKDFFTAHAAADSLKKLRDRRAVEPLIRQLEDKESGGFRRVLSAQILGVLGDPRAISALAKALHDDNEDIQKAARESLLAFAPTHPDAILQLPPNDRHRLGRLIQENERDEFTKSVCG